LPALMLPATSTRCFTFRLSMMGYIADTARTMQPEPRRRQSWPPTRPFVQRAPRLARARSGQASRIVRAFSRFTML